MDTIQDQCPLVGPWLGRCWIARKPPSSGLPQESPTAAEKSQTSARQIRSLPGACLALTPPRGGQGEGSRARLPVLPISEQTSFQEASGGTEGGALRAQGVVPPPLQPPT